VSKLIDLEKKISTKHNKNPEIKLSRQRDSDKSIQQGWNVLFFHFNINQVTKNKGQETIEDFLIPGISSCSYLIRNSMEEFGDFVR
jgi:hypothetical protein